MSGPGASEMSPFAPRKQRAAERLTLQARVTCPHCWHHFAPEDNLWISLYDNAGEHFLPGQDTVGSPVTRHLARSRVLFYLFDPTQDPRFRKACSGKTHDPQMADGSRTMRQETILLEAADRIRRYGGLAQGQQHAAPLVVVVTKYDAISNDWHRPGCHFLYHVGPKYQVRRWSVRPMRHRLREFAESVRLAPTDRHAERIVRIMLEEVAKDCPIHVLVYLGQSLVKYRNDELREQAERN